MQSEIRGGELRLAVFYNVEFLGTMPSPLRSVVFALLNLALGGRIIHFDQMVSRIA